ncbi:MAG: hypothetical protein ABR905_13525 [Terracidiphilus sp.]|jgi:hypothetical protein
MSTDPEELSAIEETGEESVSSHVLRAVGWVSVGITLAAISIFVGRELRSRYKFKRRTPYDFYDHAGESEFGVGV